MFAFNRILLVFLPTTRRIDALTLHTLGVAVFGIKGREFRFGSDCCGSGTLVLFTHHKRTEFFHTWGGSDLEGTQNLASSFWK